VSSCCLATAHNTTCRRPPTCGRFCGCLQQRHQQQELAAALCGCCGHRPVQQHAVAQVLPPAAGAVAALVVCACSMPPYQLSGTMRWAAGSCTRGCFRLGGFLCSCAVHHKCWCCALDIVSSTQSALHAHGVHVGVQLTGALWVTCYTLCPGNLCMFSASFRVHRGMWQQSCRPHVQCRSRMFRIPVLGCVGVPPTFAG
jgi:hypothetical protein